jgi:acetyl-CoA synthetase
MDRQPPHEEDDEEDDDDDDEALIVARLLAQASAVANTPAEQWQYLYRQILTPNRHTFAIHRQCFEQIHDGGTAAIDTAPLWYPPSNKNKKDDPSSCKPTHCETVLAELGLSSYEELYQYSITKRDAFWLDAANVRCGIIWETFPTAAFGTSSTSGDTYFPHGRLNIVDSCLKTTKNHHHKPALIFQRHGSIALESWDTGKLTQWVDRIAHCLVAAFGSTSDRRHRRRRIAVILPLTPESVAIYLAIIKAGYTVVSIADSFAAHEIAIRCEIANVEFIITQDVILRPGKAVPLYDRVVEAVESLLLLSHQTSTPAKTKILDDDDEDRKEQKEEEQEDRGRDGHIRSIGDGETIIESRTTTIPIIVLPALLGSKDYAADDEEDNPLQVSLDSRPCDRSWADFLAHGSSDSPFPSVIGDSMTECNILFSSGTTGSPKAIVWTHATLIKSAADGYYHQNLHSEDVICWPTSLGWMMGSWLIAQRINDVTIALPCHALPHDWPAFSSFLRAAGVTMLGVIPSLVSAWYGQYNEGEGKHNSNNNNSFCMPDSITRFSSTGEASDPLVYHWLMSRQMGYAPIIEYCGGTEIGGSFLSSVLCLPNVASHFNTPVLGSQLALLHPETHQILAMDNHHDVTDTDGYEIRGELVLVPPTVGYSTVLLNRNHDECYFGGMPEYGGRRLRRHGDAFSKITTIMPRRKDNDGAVDDDSSSTTITTFYRALGRCDDTMNLGGIKVSSVELERVCNDAMAEICDCAAIAIGHPSKLVVYAVVAGNNNNNGGSVLATEVEVVLKTLQQSIKQRLNPLFHLRDVVLVDALPRTASNKVMRRLLRDEYLQRQQQTIAVAASAST